MNDIALVTTYFDYPEHYLPVFYQNAKKYFDIKDIHVIRYLERNTNLDGLYAKLYHYKIVKNIESYKKYLEAKFQNGMDWTNYGEWHIDHIIPCAKFNLTNPEEQKKCFHYTNTQPLWAKDNLSKGSK